MSASGLLTYSTSEYDVERHQDVGQFASWVSIVSSELTYGRRLFGIACLLLFCWAIASSQLAVVYVDATYGSDLYTGASPTDSIRGTGPKATIHGGLQALANQGQLVILAGTYAGDGVDTDGSVSNTADNADIDINLTKYPRLVSGLTIELRSLGTNQIVKVFADESSVLSPNGALISHTPDDYIPNLVFNIPGGVLTLTTTHGTEYLVLAGRHSSGNPVSSVFLVAGSIDMLQKSCLRLISGATISFTGSASFLHEVPSKESDLNLMYQGGGSIVAGGEASYGSYGSGRLVVNKDVGTSIVFPSDMSFSGNNDAIRLNSGNVTFKGGLNLGRVGSATETARTADIISSSEGVVRFEGSVTLFVTGRTPADSTISSIRNLGPGSLIAAQPVTWVASFNSSSASYTSSSSALVWNAAGGSVTFESGLLLTHAMATAGAAPATIDVQIQNDANGRIRLGQPLTVIPRNGLAEGLAQKFSVGVANLSTGTLDLSGALGGGLSSSGGVVNVNGSLTLGELGRIAGQLRITNGGVLSLGPNTLTLLGAGNNSTSGSIINVTTGGIVVGARGTVAFDGGAFPGLTINQGTEGITTIGGTSSFASLNVSSGALYLQSTANVTGALTLDGGVITLPNTAGMTLTTSGFKQTGGTLNLGGELRVKGNFLRSGGAIVVDPASLISIAGNGPQSFDPGPTLQLASLMVGNPNGSVSLLRTVYIRNALTISAGSLLELGSSSVVLNGEGAVFTVNGSYSASDSGVVMGGATTFPLGASVRNLEIHAGPGVSLRSLYVDVGFNNICALTAPADLEWSGVLSLLSGSLDVASPVDFHPGGSNASVVRDVVNAGSITTSKGSFNAVKAAYNLEYKGRLAGNLLLPSADLRELANVLSLSVNVDSDGEDGDGNLLTGTPRYFLLPASGISISGSLNIGSLAAVRLSGNGQGGDFIELRGTGVQHTIRGRLDTSDDGDYLLIDGASVTLSGGLQPNDVSLIGNISISSSSLCSITAIRGFTGSFTANPGSIIKLSMGSPQMPDSIRSTQQRIAGSLSLNGVSLTLGSSVEIQHGVSFNSGLLNFDRYDLQLTTAGDYVQGPIAAGYTAAGGSLVMNRRYASLRIGESESLGLPRLRILSDTYVLGIGRVTNDLQIGSLVSVGIPTLILDIARRDLIFTGGTISLLSNGRGNTEAVTANNSPDGTPGGRILVAGSAVDLRMNSDYRVNGLVFNPPSGAGTLTFSAVDGKAHVLTVGAVFTHAGGVIALGINHLALEGTGTVAGARAYNGSGGTITASTGEVRFTGAGPQEFSIGTPLSIPNLLVRNASGVTKFPASTPLTVSRSLDLSDGTLSYESGSLLFEMGVSIVRRRSSALLGAPAVFQGWIDVSYLLDGANGDLTTGYEMPMEMAVVRNFHVSNPNTSRDADNVRMERNVTVTGVLYLDSGELDLGASDMTIGQGATIEVNGGRFRMVGGVGKAPQVSTYNLAYHASATVIGLTPEFQSGPGISIASLSVAGSHSGPRTVLFLNADQTVGNLILDAPNGGIEFGSPGSFSSRKLIVTGDVTVLNGTFSNSSGTSGLIDLAGVSQQVITVPATGLTFQGGTSAVNVRLNNQLGFSLRGGDLMFGEGSTLYFQNGVLSTEGNAVSLFQTPTSLGFDRQYVLGSNISHVSGRVRHHVRRGAGNSPDGADGRYEFPVGSLTEYRSLAITFVKAYPAADSSTVEVTHFDNSPGGNTGLPLDGEVGIVVGDYSRFYWLVSSSPASSGDLQTYDLEASLRNPAFRFSKPDDLRFIHRRNGPPALSPWTLQGPGLGYGKSGVSFPAPGDMLLTVKVVATRGGLNGESVFAIGLPTQPPSFARVLPDTTIAENQSLKFRYALTDSSQAGSIKYTLVNPPKDAIIDSVTGVLTWTPTYGQAGTYTVVVAASDGRNTVVVSSRVVVLHVNRKPVLNFRIPATLSQVAFNTTVTFRISATDPDGGPLTITWKIDGTVVKSGTDTSFTYTFQGKADRGSVRAVFADAAGLADSTNWDFTIVSVTDPESGIPSVLALEQNYPNPFNPSTLIRIAVPQRSTIFLAVYTIQGQLLRVLLNREMEAGLHQVIWDGCDATGARASSGIYLCRMISGSFVESRKMVLVR